MGIASSTAVVCENLAYLMGASEVKERKLLMLGPLHSGKTSILNRLKYGEIKKPVPTTDHFHIETLLYKQAKFEVYEVSLYDKLVGGWNVLLSQYYKNTAALLFVVDASQPVEEAREALAHVLADRALDGVTLLLLATKQDLPMSKNADEVGALLGLSDLPQLKGRDWDIMGCNVSSGEGLSEALEWVYNQVCEDVYDYSDDEGDQGDDESDHDDGEDDATAETAAIDDTATADTTVNVVSYQGAPQSSITNNHSTITQQSLNDHSIITQ